MTAGSPISSRIVGVEGVPEHGEQREKQVDHENNVEGPFLPGLFLEVFHERHAQKEAGHETYRQQSK